MPREDIITQMTEDQKRTVAGVYSKCPMPCDEVVYRTTSSVRYVSPIPTKHRKDNIYNFTLSVHLELMNSLRVVEERPLQTWRDLLAYAGGVTGLLLGVSFISVFEMFNYITLCCFERLLLAIKTK